MRFMNLHFTEDVSHYQSHSKDLVGSTHNGTSNRGTVSAEPLNVLISTYYRVNGP